MAMATTVKAGVAASVLFVAAASAFYWLAQESDPGGYQRGGADIRQIRQLSTEWSVETARVRSDPLGDYDALAAFIPAVARLKDSLLGTVRDTPAMPERLANDVYAFASALDAKEERIERFKTANSVIRNSVRYLPNAAASIARTASDAGLADDVTALADGLGQYAASPTDEAKGRLSAIFERLVDRGAGLPDGQANTLSNFLAHAGILLERQVPTERIFRQATSGEVSDLAGELLGEFDAQATKLERRASLYMTGVWGSAVALLLAWVFALAVRSRPARPEAASASREAEAVRSAPAEAVPAEAAPVEAAEAVANGAGIHHEQADASRKPLLAQRILAEVVAARVARAVRALPLADDAETAAEEMEEIAMLAERFAAGSAARNDRYDLIDLKDCVGAALEAVGVADSATVVAELGDAPQVFASKTELCLMLEQVLDNAAWAIRQKGLDAEEGEIRIKTDGGDDACVTILDNGVGLSAEDRDRMFLPFAGARDDRPGVGLAITEHIVRRYGGRIAVGSQPGGGTVLRISLPGMAA